MIVCYCGSSLSEVFCKKGVFRNFTRFTGKHLCQSLFFNKVAGLRPTTLVNKRLQNRYFPVNSVKFLRTPFYRTPLVAASITPKNVGCYDYTCPE